MLDDASPRERFKVKLFILFLQFDFESLVSRYHCSNALFLIKNI